MIGIDSARWDMGGPKFTKSGRSSMGVDPSSKYNKKLYRIIKDIRTGTTVMAPVVRDMITTPHVQDLAVAMENIKSKRDPSEVAIKTSPVKIYTQVWEKGEGGRKKKVLKLAEGS